MVARKQKTIVPKKRARTVKAALPRHTSQASYARHRNVSRVAVSKAIASDRLKDSLIVINGVAWIRDVALADKEWAANTDLSRAHDAVKSAAAQSKVLPFVPVEPQPGSMADASTREKHWRALKAELDYKRAAGELVDAAAIQARIVEIFTTCRTKLLGLPTKAKQRLPHLALADVSALDDVVRESLEELVPERVSS